MVMLMWMVIMVMMVVKMAVVVMVMHWNIKRETDLPSILVKWLPALSALLTYSRHTSGGGDRWLGKDSTLFIHIHMNTHAQTHTNTNTYTHTHAHTHKHTCTHMRKHTQTHTNTHKHTHTHSRTHTHRHTLMHNFTTPAWVRRVLAPCSEVGRARNIHVDESCQV